MSEKYQPTTSEDSASSWGDWHAEGYPVESANNVRQHKEQVISPVPSRETSPKLTSLSEMRHDFYDDVLSNQMANGGE